MKKNKLINLVIILVLIIVMIASLIYSFNKFTKVKNDIDNSLSIENITNEKIASGILTEKARIQKEEYGKIWYPEIGILSIGTILIIGILIINNKKKEEKK